MFTSPIFFCSSISVKISLWHTLINCENIIVTLSITVAWILLRMKSTLTGL
jgi:hypothetical protein